MLPVLKVEPRILHSSARLHRRRVPDRLNADDTGSQEEQADEDEIGMAVFLDKLSERLAFERRGDACTKRFTTKLRRLAKQVPGPTLEQIEQIGREELEHFLMVNRTITELGGDSTVESPSADVGGVASMGIMQVLTDRELRVPMLAGTADAELTDNDGWQLLIQLATTSGLTIGKGRNLKRHLQTR